MHLRHSDDHDHGPKEVPVRFILENPGELLDPDHYDGPMDKAEHEVMAAKGEHLLEVAVEHGINIEHACGGVCACSTCHVYVEQGMDSLE
jgi:ferredoxin